MNTPLHPAPLSDGLIAYCKSHQLQPTILAFPYALADASLFTQLQHPDVSAILSANGIADCNAIKRYIPEQYDWELPLQSSSRTVALDGPIELVSFPMLLQALRHKIYWLAYATPTGYSHQPIIKMVLFRALHRAAWQSMRLIEQSLSYPGQQLIPVIRTLQPIRQIINGDDSPLLDPQASVPGRIIMIHPECHCAPPCQDLRTTLFGIVHQGYSDLTLLVESDSHPAELNDLFQNLSHPAISTIPLTADLYQQHLDAIDPTILQRLQCALHSFPPEMATRIMTIAVTLLQRRPDVVHLWSDSLNVCGGIAAVLVGVPQIVVTFDGTPTQSAVNFSGRFLRAGYRLLLTHPDLCIISRNEQCTKAYLQWLGLSGLHVEHIYAGFNLDSAHHISIRQLNQNRQSIGINSNALLIGTVCQFSESDEILLWIETAAKVATLRPDTFFILIGNEPQQKVAAQAAKAAGMDHCLITMGLTNRSQTVAMFNLFLSTTNYTTTAYPIIEAQSLAVPVVATGSSFARQAIDNGISGWIVDQQTSEALAKRIINMLDHTEWFKEAGDHGSAFVRQRFSLQKMASETLRCYGYPPALAPVNFKQRDCSTSALRQEVDYAITIGSGYLSMIRTAGLDPKMCRVLELGPGINYGAMMVLASYGVQPAVADRFPGGWSSDYHPAFYKLLGETVKTTLPGLDCSIFDRILDAEGYPDDCLKVIETGAEEMTMIEDADFNVTCSTAVFEHLHSPSRAISELSRITRSGGWGFHSIDFRDHRNFSRPLEYLLFDPREFERFFRHILAESGRQYRPKEIAELFQSSGFSVTECIPDIYVEPGYLVNFIPRLRAAKNSRYCNFSEEDLRVISARFTVQKK